jgi:hypothetical protein
MCTNGTIVRLEEKRNLEVRDADWYIGGGRSMHHFVELVKKTERRVDPCHSLYWLHSEEESEEEY